MYVTKYETSFIRNKKIILTWHHSFRTYYEGSEVVVAGRVDDSAAEITSQVHAFCGNEGESGKIPYDVTLKAPVPQTKNYYLPLERLWAYLTVKQLLDEKDAQLDTEQSKDKEKSPEKKALNIALKYELVTPLTSLVVVKPNATKDAVNAESVDKVDSVQNGFPGAPLSALYSSSLPLAHYQGSVPIAQASFESFPQPGLRLNAPLTRDTGVVEKRVDTTTTAHVADQLQYDDVETAEYALEEQPVVGFDTPDDMARPRPTQYAYMQVAQVAHPTTPFIDPLQRYHLEAYPWALTLINITTDSLLVEVNGTTLNMKLSTDNTIPKSPGGDPVCNNAIDNTTGVCVYLLNCVAAQSITVEKYVHSACVVDTGYAGVCCPNVPDNVNKPV